MKKIQFVMILLLSLCISNVDSASVVAATVTPIKVSIDGVYQTYDQPPLIENNRVLVPFRGVLETLGAKVNWDPTKQEITAIKEQQQIWLKIGSKTAKINEAIKQLDAPVKINNNRTLVPLRFVSEALGANVKWLPEKNLVQITMNSSDQEVLPQFKHVQSGDPIVTLKTSKGDIKIKLFPDRAPKAVENFLTHSKNGYYDGLTFHRVITDFMIQGGDPVGNSTGGESIWGTPFIDEFSADVAHFRGALSMANSGPNTNGSQFFIVQANTIDESLIDQMKEAGFNANIIEKYKTIGGTPWLDYHHTVFGQVIEGLEIVDQIATVKVDQQNKPVTPIYIKEIIVGK